MHVILLGETANPINFEAFREWILSRDYGSKPYFREIRLFDLNINYKVLDKFLADLKYYEHHGKTKRFWKFFRFLGRIFKLKPVNMEKIEKTPEKWFEPIKFKSPHCPQLYLKILGCLDDAKHPWGDDRI